MSSVVSKFCHCLPGLTLNVADLTLNFSLRPQVNAQIYPLFFRVESVSFSDWYILSFLLRFYYCSQSSIYYNQFQFMLTTFQILSYMKEAGGVRHLSGVDSLGFQRCRSSSQACPAGTVTHWPICQLGFSTQNLGEQSCLLAKPHQMEKASHHPARERY